MKDKNTQKIFIITLLGFLVGGILGFFFIDHILGGPKLRQFQSQFENSEVTNQIEKETNKTFETALQSTLSPEFSVEALNKEFYKYYAKNDYDKAMEVAHAAVLSHSNDTKFFLLNHFRIYDCFIAKSLATLLASEKQIFALSIYNDINAVFEEIYLFKNQASDLEIITNDTYMNNLYELALLYIESRNNAPSFTNFILEYAPKKK